MASALKEWTPVSTSRPAPAVLQGVYEQAERDGATAVHPSTCRSSGTFESAELAARRSIPVTVVDTRQVGVATGFAARPRPTCWTTAAPSRRPPRRPGCGPTRRRRSSTSTPWSTSAAADGSAPRPLFGSALAVKPLLQIADGRVATLEKVRTAAKALNRLEELAVQAADGRQIDLCVAHLASPDRAAQLTERLGLRLADNLSGREIWHGELGAVLGAHVGPGMLAVCVSPRP